MNPEPQPLFRDTKLCGPFRLTSLLCSGGMSSVYLGERIDGELQQQVAVKLLRIDDHRPDWRNHFLDERQFLASLRHPAIVHLIGAGHTDDGQPYLAMEYVEGVAIDVYSAGIGVRERLELFLRVCDGVAHAHRHLIVHRDLKPANILVNSTGQPKVLDFGIAKLLEGRDSSKMLAQFLTPHYASPEQLTGASQTTYTDIYSLGAVLYKVLTGRVPRETQTTPPQNIVPPSRWNPDVPKDLDYILAKALRTEPEERYVSVNEFAEDVSAALESRPVTARASDAWYRARKALRRYWAPAAAAMLVISALSAGLYVANQQRGTRQPSLCG